VQAEVTRSSRPSAVSRLVVVAGAGRSGTSTLAGLLSHLGVWAPEPHIRANNTNPKGFYESAWVVGFHKRLLESAAVPQYDARPEAFELTAQVAADPAVEEELRRWLATQFDTTPEILIKDPRVAWFLPLWSSIARGLDARPGVAMSVRHPAEVVRSYAHHYLKKREPRPLDGTNRTANWINLTLETERATREAPRVFVRYSDILADWRPAAERIGAVLDLSFDAGIPAAAAAEVDGFIDTSLHRIQATWDDVDAPDTVVALAEAVWQQITRLIDDGESDDARAALDDIRGEYRRLYAEAEEIARSSIRAAHAAGAREATAERDAERHVESATGPGAVPAAGAEPPTQGAKSILRHGVARVRAIAKRDG
jgi:hypothetical protein